MFQYLIVLLLFFYFWHHSMKNNDDLFNYNTNISNIINKLNNINNRGFKYWKKFINKVKFINSNTNIDNIHIQFEKAEIYLDKSINDYLSYIYNISDINKINNISTLVNQLNKEGKLILYNLSLKINSKWNKDPNVNNKEIFLSKDIYYKNNLDVY